MTDYRVDQLPILKAAELLERLNLDPTKWRAFCGLDDGAFQQLIIDPFLRYAELVQLAPASEAHHHAGPGGLLAHTFDVITIALKQRRGYQLPIGGTLDEISDQRHVWTFAVFAACLLHDIGKLFARICILINQDSGVTRAWNPHYPPLTEVPNAVSYQIQFNKVPYHYHSQVALSMFHLLPPVARPWLTEQPHVLAQLCAFLQGDRFESGTIGEIVEGADRISTAKSLQIPVSQRFSQTIPTIDRYMGFIRDWIKQRSIRINVNGAMGWVSREGFIYFVCAPLADKIMKQCDELELYDVPRDRVLIYDTLQEHGYALSTADGKAIWTIKVETEEYQHVFTCLKLDTRRLTTPTTLLKPLDGTVKELSSDEYEAEKKRAATTKKQDTETKKNQATVERDSTKQHEAETKHQHETEKETKSDNEPSLEDLMFENGEREDSRETETSPSSHEPEKNERIEDERKLQGLTMATEGLGQIFFDWLKRGILDKSLPINNVKARVHIVPEGVFLLSPGIFKDFLAEHKLDTDTNSHTKLSGRFRRLKLHVKYKSTNIHPYWAVGKNKQTRINGWILPHKVIFGNKKVPELNKYIKRYNSE